MIFLKNVLKQAGLHAKGNKRYTFIFSRTLQSRDVVTLFHLFTILPYMEGIVLICNIDPYCVIAIYVTQLRSGEDPELRNTLNNASYRGGQAAKCFKYSPTEGDGSVRAIRSSPG